MILEIFSLNRRDEKGNKVFLNFVTFARFLKVAFFGHILLYYKITLFRLHFALLKSYIFRLYFAFKERRISDLQITAENKLPSTVTKN